MRPHRQRTSRAAAVLLAALVAACGADQPPPPPPAIPATRIVPLDEASVLGSVQDGLGNAVADAEVWFETPVGAEPAAAVLARTDAGGRFRAALPAPIRVHVSIAAGELPPLLLSGERQLQPGSTTDLGPLVLRSYPGLLVQVTGPPHRPLAGALVTVAPQLLPAALPPHASAVFARSQHTDRAGCSRLRALPPGRYTVAVEAQGHASRELPFPCTGSAEPQTLEVALDRAPVLRGTIDARAGRNQRVLAAPLDGGQVLQAAPDFGDRFRFEGLPPGPCRVGLEAADGSRTWFGPVANDANVALPALHGAAATGLVRSTSGEPLAGATVTLRPGPPLAPVPGLLIDRIEARCGEDGRFQFAAVPPGRYELVATSDGYAPHLSRLPSVPNQPILLELAPADTLDVRVADARGLPLAGAAVECLPLANLGELAGVLPPVPRLSGTTDLDGRFSFRGLADGSYVVRARARGCGPECSEPLAFARGRAPAAAQLRLRPGASCAGRVTRAGEPAAGGTVQALPRKPGEAGGKAAVGADGSYRLDALPAGEHVLVYSVSAAAEPAARPTATATILLQAGATARHDFDLP